MNNGVPPEIKPYVAVGPTGYAITIHKRTFDTAFIVFTLVFGLILIFFVILTIYYANVNARLPNPPPPLFGTTQVTIHSNFGAAMHSASKIDSSDATQLTDNEKCENMPNTIWTQTGCQCKSPFFGPTCSRERHDKNYYAVGIPNETVLGMTIIDELMSDGKSFTDNSCSNYCDNTSGCHSFIYHPYGRCTLLTDDIIIPKGSGISYSLDLDATLYMKTSENLHFEDRIFLGAFNFSLPPRFWLVHKSFGYAQLLVNMVSTIDFIPTYSKIYGSHIGIYCTHEFSREDINIILNRGATTECYIHQPGKSLQIPLDWQYKLPLYVVYL